MSIKESPGHIQGTHSVLPNRGWDPTPIHQGRLGAAAQGVTWGRRAVTR